MKTSIVVPQDSKGRILLAIAASFAGATYLGRMQFAGFFVETLDTLLSAIFLVCPVFCLVAFILHLLVTYRYVVRFGGHRAPGILLCGGMLLAILLPTPPTPEEISFRLQRPLYEQVVELARAKQLGRSGECLDQEQYLPPSGYYQWSSECIFVRDTGGLMIEFSPRSLERPIVYLDKVPEAESSLCRRDGANGASSTEGLLFKKLNGNWFICRRFGVDDHQD